jgi:subtilisin family serine protease
MQIATRCAPALLLALAFDPQPACAQIRLPSLPLTLPAQTLQNTTQLLDQTESRTLQHLSDLRHLEIAQMLRTSPAQLELDPDGQPIVRSEILALGPGDNMINRALAAGFTIARQQNLEALGVHVVVLTVPKRLATKKALRQLRGSDPAGTYDYNHIYLGSGEIRPDGAPPPTAAPKDSADISSASSKIRVGLIDTGIDTSHPAFGAASIHRWGCADKAIPAAHGTAVASILIGHSDIFHGVQPTADLYSADVYCGTATGGAVDTLLAAFGWLVQEKVPVINVSLVGPKNAMLEAVIARLVASGFIVVAAVGNDGPAAPPLYPASYPGVIGVTAVDARHKVLIEAARGPQVMFAAIGADTAAAGVKHDYAVVRGTSFAAPIIAGLLAAEVNAPDAVQVTLALQALENQAVDLGPVGRDFTYGFGLVGAEFRVDPASLQHH